MVRCGFVGQFDDHFVHGVCQFHGAFGAEERAGFDQSPFEFLNNGIRDESDADVRFDPPFFVMMDRPDAQVGL